MGAWYSSESIQLIFSGQPGRHGDGERAARPEHPRQLGDRADVVLDVLEHLGGDDAVERAVGERQAGGVAAQHADEALGADLAGVDHAAERARVSTTSSLGVVEGHDAAPPRRAASNTWRPKPAADVEHEVAGLQAELGRTGSVSTSDPAVPAQLGDVRRHGQDLAVLVDGELGAVPPAPALDHPLAAGGADPVRAARGSSRPRRMVRGQRLGVAGAGSWSTVSPSVPVTSGSAPPSVATRQVPVAHRLDRPAG